MYLVAVDNVDGLPEEDIPEEQDISQEGGQRTLIVHDPDGQVIDF